MADNYTQIFNLALSGLARGLDARSHARIACLAAYGGDKKGEKLGRPQAPQRGLPPLGIPLSGQIAKMCIIVSHEWTGVLAWLPRSPSLDGALWKIHQPFEPMDSGPHTNLGFGDGGLFIRPLSCLLSGEGVLSHGSRPHPDGVGLSRLRERRGIYQVRTSVSQTEVTVKLREAIEGCFTTQAQTRNGFSSPGWNRGGFQARLIVRRMTDVSWYSGADR